jgi:hypothetical protein
MWHEFRFAQETADGYHNLQIQANYQAKSTSVRKEAPKTVATVLVLEGADPLVTPEEVRAAFQISYKNQNSTERLGLKSKPEDSKSTHTKSKNN